MLKDDRAVRQRIAELKGELGELRTPEKIETSLERRKEIKAELKQLRATLPPAVTFEEAMVKSVC